MTYQNTINMYVQETKLTNVSGRVSYISDQSVQREKLLGVCGQRDMLFWQMLSSQCQHEFKSPSGQCIEAREYIIYLPNNMSEDKLPSLKRCIDALTGTDCLLALHDSHAEEEGKPGNRHVHAIVPERRQLLEPEIRIAERNYFINEEGKRVRTKKEIMENGELRPGCSIIPKDEVYHKRFFSSKNELLARADYFHEIKQELADWINQELQPDFKRVVYDSEVSPFIPQFKIKEGTPADTKKDKEICNSYFKAYNQMIRNGEIEYELAMQYKTLIMLSPDRAAEVDNILNLYEGQNVPDNTASVPRTPNLDPSKENLRLLYKRAGETRKKIKETENSIERKILQAEVRGVSAEIDRMRKRLGLYQLADYKKTLERENREAEYHRNKIKRLNRSINYLNSSIMSTALNFVSWIEFMKRELAKGKKDSLELAFAKAMMVIHYGKSMSDEEIKNFDAAALQAMIDDEYAYTSTKGRIEDLMAELEISKEDFKKVKEDIKTEKKEMREALKKSQIARQTKEHDRLNEEKS